MNFGGLRSPADRRAAAAASAAATVIIALQLSAKSTRDALFLSTFGVSFLPAMVIVAAVLSMVLTLILARAMARTRPGRLVPRLFVLSGMLVIAEWMLAIQFRRPAAILVYLHFNALGALLVSGFWAMVNERFDPRTARQAIGRITAGGSVGGLIGGLLPERVGAALSLTAMLPILAGMHLLAAGLVLGVEQGRPDATTPDEGFEEAPSLSAARILRGSAYLMGLALLVALSSTAEGLLDYVFKARATAAADSGEELLRLFAAFYTVTALLGIFIQVSVLRRVLARFGIARSAALLPAGVAAGAVGAFFIPGLTPIVVARGTEVVLRNSLFRAAYELLFTPIAPREKRATKLLLDVGAARVGDIIGGALILVAIAITGAAAGRLLLALTFVLAVGALYVARRLHLGYVAALEGSLHRRAGQLPEVFQDDTTSMLQTVGAFDLSGIRARVPGLATPAPEPQQPEAAPLGPATPLARAIRNGKAEEVRNALRDHPLTDDQVEPAINLLAWDDVAPAAIRSLAVAARTQTPVLLRHLLDPDEDFAIRRRLVNALADCRSVEAFEGLLQALEDRRFEVRYRAGRALSRMTGDMLDAPVDRELVVSLILRELTVDRSVWESRQLIDAPDDEASPMEADLIRDRASRSLEHLFTLMALIYPPQTLRLAFHGLHTADPYLRGTALEYLETVLPEPIWARLWPLVEEGERQPARPRRSADEALQELLASRVSISAALTKGGGRPGPEPGPARRARSPHRRP
jgi:AAA family ATP:ADP antiporter